KPYALPAGFSWPGSALPPILWDGATHTTPYDVAVRQPAVGATLWIDPVSGVNSNDGSEASPKKSLASALTAAAHGDQINIKNGDSRLIIFREEATGSGGTTQTKGVAI